MNNGVTSMGEHYSTLIYRITFHMQTTLSIIFPALMTRVLCFFGSQEPALRLQLLAWTEWHIFLNDTNRNMTSTCVDESLLLRQMSMWVWEERRNTYCRAHIRIGLPGICRFQDTGQEIHPVQLRLHTGSCYYIWKHSECCFIRQHQTIKFFSEWWHTVGHAEDVYWLMCT